MAKSGEARAQCAARDEKNDHGLHTQRVAPAANGRNGSKSDIRVHAQGGFDRPSSRRALFG
jgi:hypothetical protein